MEIVRDQAAHLARLVVVGVVVTSREHIGADQNASLHLVAKTGAAGFLVHGIEAALALHAQAIAHTVIAREVRRSLGRRDNIVGRQRVLGVRQGDFDDLGASRRQPVSALLPELFDLLGHAVDTVLLGQTDLQTFDVAGQRRLVTRHRAVHRG